MHWLEFAAIRLGRFLAQYGGWGLFAISFLDSSFLFFPVLNDVLLMHLASRHPARAPFYTAMSTAGSVLGCLAVYELGRRGTRLFRRNPEMRQAGRARRWLQRNDFATVLVASLLPPPTPFKVVPIVAGALEINAVRLCVALIVGRGLRFLLEAWIGMRYGAEAEHYLRDHLALLSFATIALVVFLWAVYRRLQKTAPAQ